MDSKTLALFYFLGAYNAKTSLTGASLVNGAENAYRTYVML